MNTLLEVLFIAVILSGTTTDFIIRQLLPGDAVLVNVGCLFFAISASFLFYKIISSKQFSLPPPVLSSASDNMPPRGTLALTPINSLISANDPLLIIRFFAAFLVFITHMMILFKPSQEIINQEWQVLAGGAHSGMAIFFTLSGFLMGKAFISGRYALSRSGIFTFYQSRWVRIVPLMSFVCVFLFVLVYPQVIRFEPLAILRLITFNYYGNTLGLNGIGAMWSLSVEVQYYLIAPFIFSIFHSMIVKNKMKGILIVAITIIGFAAANYFSSIYLFHKPNLYTPVYFSLIGNLPFFLIGFLFNYLQIPVTDEAAKTITKGWFILSMLFLFYLFCNNHSESIHYFMVVSLITGMIITVLSGVSNKGAFLTLRRFSAIKILQLLGVLSYGFYLWHSGIGFIYAKLFPEGIATRSAYLTEITIIGLIVLFVSVISFVLVEDRFNAYKSINKITSS